MKSTQSVSLVDYDFFIIYFTRIGLAVDAFQCLVFQRGDFKFNGQSTFDYKEGTNYLKLFCF